MRGEGSVSPIENGDGSEEQGNRVWENMMKPFDQDVEGNEEPLDEKEEAEEGMKAKVVRQGYFPTQKEIDEHVVTHTPYRAWCQHSVSKVEVMVNLTSG